MEWSFIFALVFVYLCSILLVAAIVFEVLSIKDRDY